MSVTLVCPTGQEIVMDTLRPEEFAKVIQSHSEVLAEVEWESGE